MMMSRATAWLFILTPLASGAVVGLWNAFVYPLAWWQVVGSSFTIGVSMVKVGAALDERSKRRKP